MKQGQGETRGETEVELDQGTFDELWPESEGRTLTKIRHRIELEGGLVAELDIYTEQLEDLATVEVEFDSHEAVTRFQPPSWFGRELTGDKAWANQSLAVFGKPDKRLQFRLRPEEEPGSGLCRIITARTAQAGAEVRAAAESEDSAKHVHVARKSLKKARSALRLLRGVIGDEERSEVNQACRDAAGHLSGARDAEVKLATLTVVLGETDPPGTSEWRAQLEQEAAAHRGSLNSESLAEVTAAIEGVRRQFLERELKGSGEAVAGNLGRGYRRGRKAMRRASKSEEVEAFHDWRKRAKDLRYQLEILGPRLPEEFDETRKTAENLAEMLGDLHDLDVLAEDLGQRSLPRDDQPHLAELINHAREKLADDCLSLGAQVYKVKPSRFTNQVSENLNAGV